NVRERTRFRLSSQPLLENVYVPELIRRKAGGRFFGEIALDGQGIDPTFAGGNGITKQRFKVRTPAPGKPTVYGNAEPTLFACGDAFSNPAAGNFAQYGLQDIVVQADFIGQRLREIPQFLIEEWRTGFQCVPHAPAVDLGHEFS